ncbi:hypothetical protein PENSPDRAFT_747881 [Peniophora sp. CONT]|nr:hypothetical protein PENSPDRAFT_747881 [Peniophora sp. CONT]
MLDTPHYELEHTPSVQDGAVGISPNNPEELAKRGESLFKRFQRLNELESLDRAIDVQQRANVLMPDDHPQRLQLLTDLGLSLWYRYTNFGRLEDLENAIAAEKVTLKLTPEDHLARPMRLANLAVSLHSRFERLGEVRDLEEAIEAEKLARDLTPEDHPERPLRLNDLATSLHSRFERLGDIRDLEEAIEAKKLARDLTPKDHPERPERLDNLATSLHSRFERLGDVRDLEEAIEAKKLALELTPEGHPERPFRLNNLATSLHSRFERLDDIRDLEEAIEAKKLARDLTPEGHPDRPRRLAGLAVSLHSRFEHLGEIRDLEDTIAADRLALNLTPEGHPERPRRLANLATSLWSRFERLGEIHDLESAITAERLVINLTPESHPDRPRRLYHLGISMQTRFEQHQSKVHFDAAFKEFLNATEHSLGNPSIRLLSAQACVSLLSKYPDFGSAELLLDAHSRIIQIFPEIVWLGHSVKRRYEESAKLADLVNAAISAFIGSRSRYQAIEWMEVGRSLVWSQISALREPIDDLAMKHPELAEDLQKVSLALQQSGSTSHPALHGELERSGEKTQATVPHPGSASTQSSAEDCHRRLAIEYQDMLKKVRKLKGFEDFLHPPSITSRMPSIELLDGPVVFINVHSSSCDALALLPNGAVKHIPLPDLTRDRAHNLQSIWSGLFKSPDIRKRAVVSSARLFLQGRPTNMFGSVLWKLWIWVMRPILQALNFMKTPASDLLPHITWCPTGPLTQLPLHAAGIYDFFEGTLLRSHEDLRARPPPSRPNVLVVAQPETPGYAALPHTRHESERISNVLTNSTPTILMDKAATVVNTTAALRMCTWVHLACHGYQDTQDPTQSAFALVDRPLTLSALMGATADNAELAFLSACETAVGDENNPEESVHLAAGMLAVGFKGVVATMWSIWDVDAPVIVEAYYRKLIELRGSGKLAPGYTGAAYALHEAMKILRERVDEEKFVRWAPFVHFGV